MSSEVVQFPASVRKNKNRFIPERLRAARKARRVSQVDLGQMVGLTRQAISAFERGDKFPEPATVAKFCGALDQPMSFFTADMPDLFGRFSPRFFRKFGPETVRRNEACEVLGEWFVRSARYLDDYVNYPEINIPEFSPHNDTSYSFEEIQEAADFCRVHWGLGKGPISNVTALLESKGVVICRYELGGENVEAFSFWSGPRPFIFMTSEKECGVRNRFDLAHELGHLVLHRWIEETELQDKAVLKRVEQEADKFAGAFLLPQKSFMNEVYTPRLDAFVPLKKRWRVSIQAMIYRCSDLGLFDSEQVLKLRKQISFRKWRKKEPLDDPNIIPIEQPKLLKKAVEMIIDSKRLHPDDIISDLSICPSLLEAFYNLPPNWFRKGEIDYLGPTLKGS